MTTQSNGSNLLVQGRLIWTLGSSIFAGNQKKDHNTKQPIVGADGQPVIEYGFGLAIPKMDANGQPTQMFQQVWNTLYQEAFTLYPSGQLPPGFAMKMKDGDTDVDQQGQPYSKREGYAGHLVLACTTRIPIKYFIFQGGNNVLVNDGIKCGDYVNVQLNIKAHPAKGQGKPGLYLNPSAVQLIQPGKEIINAPSGDQVFGQQVPSYVGQVVAPEAGQIPNMNAPVPGQFPTAPPTMPGHQMPAAPSMPQTAAPSMPQTAAPGQVAPPMPGQAPQAEPYHNVLPPSHQPVNTGYPPVGAPPMPGQVPTGHTPPQGSTNVAPPMPGMPPYQQG